MCSIEKDPYNRKLNNLEPFHLQEIINMYRGFAQYYQNISQEANKSLINWLFALNTGGLLFILPFFKKLGNWQILEAAIFFIGILLVFFAVQFEKNKFDKLGNKLENIFNDFNNEKISARYFIDQLPKLDVDYSWISGRFEIISFVFWLGGAILGFYLNYTLK